MGKDKTEALPGSPRLLGSLDALRGSLLHLDGVVSVLENCKTYSRLVDGVPMEPHSVAIVVSRSVTKDQLHTVSEAANNRVAVGVKVAIAIGLE